MVMGRWKLRPEPYKPNPVDADNDVAKELQNPYRLGCPVCGSPTGTCSEPYQVVTAGSDGEDWTIRPFCTGPGTLKLHVCRGCSAHEGATSKREQFTNPNALRCHGNLCKECVASRQVARVDRTENYPVSIATV